MDSSSYYEAVADYYNRDACNYEARYRSNSVAQRIRESFRDEVKAHPFEQALEIGCGTGMDASHFGTIFPGKRIFGIDIAPAMASHAIHKVRELGLKNVRIAVGTPESLDEIFPETQFDLIYVFFGALNTVPDLPHMAGLLRNRLKSNGTMVLTFVNKWYLADTLIHLLKGRFGRAFKRFRKDWGGYSDSHHLESRCFSPWEIRRAFGGHFRITQSKGYSILYPAWYRDGLAHRFGTKLCNALWKADKALSHTPAWCLGEYALYTFKTKPGKK
jgi:ubiquinone/menaquinone biosynthesis C-methylase UbiE